LKTVNTPEIAIDVMGTNGTGLGHSQAFKEMLGDFFIAIFMKALFQGNLHRHFCGPWDVVSRESPSALLSHIHS
jgi:hypothetical protein